MKLKNVKHGVRVVLKIDAPRVDLFKGMIGTIKQNENTFPYIEWDGYAEGHCGNDDDYTKTSYRCISIEYLKLLKKAD